MVPKHISHTLLINVLLGELALLSHKVANDAAEEVGLAGAASISGSVLSCATVVYLVVALRNVTAVTNYREAIVSVYYQAERKEKG